LPYLGKTYSIKIVKRQPKNSIGFVVQHFIIKLNGSPSSTNDCTDLISKLYHDWLMRAAYPIFKNKVGEISSRLDIDTPKKIVIKELKSSVAALLLLVQ
jgi:hypothetical protein